MYTEKLIELNKCELSSNGEYEDYKFVITTYEDVTEIAYYEKNKEGKMEFKDKYDFSSCHDIQICEKIIEMRKAFKED